MKISSQLLAFLRPIWRALRPKIDYQARYESQFKSHAWDHLEGLPELGRYSIIVGYCQNFSTKKILDVACGQGILASRLKVLPYDSYLGIDFSSAAIDEACQKHGDSRTSFAIVDANVSVPSGEYDVIIFNECLFYFSDPGRVVRAYAQSLKSGGFMLVSNIDTLRRRAIWHLIEKELVVQDAVVLTNSAKASWIIKKLAPHPNRVPASVNASGG